jgi:hypothetical protein
VKLKFSFSDDLHNLELLRLHVAVGLL